MFAASRARASDPATFSGISDFLVLRLAVLSHGPDSLRLRQRLLDLNVSQLGRSLPLLSKLILAAYDATIVLGELHWRRSPALGLSGCAGDRVSEEKKNWQPHLIQRGADPPPSRLGGHAGSPSREGVQDSWKLRVGQAGLAWNPKGWPGGAGGGRG